MPISNQLYSSGGNLAPLPRMSENTKQAAESYVPLIHGLPDDLALLCLTKVPRQFHHVLRCVSRRWRGLLSSEQWHSCRRMSNLEEAWIYAMCKDNYGQNYFYVLDPERRGWRRLQPIPPACLKRQGTSFESVGNKLYLLGGCSWEEDCTNDVYCYDPSAEKWTEASKMPAARCFFMSAAVSGKIYVTTVAALCSGLRAVDNYDSQTAWDVYDSQSNSWSSEGNSTDIVDLDKSATIDGKIYTFNKTWYDSRYAKAYDPLSRTWEDVHNELSSCHCGPTVVVDGTLYMLDETMGTRLMMWQKETRKWVPLGRLALPLTRPPCQLTAIGRSIFVVGKGLSTVVVDVDKATNGRGVMVTSSFAPQLGSSFYVVGCKTIAI